MRWAMSSGVHPRASYPCDDPAEEFKDSCSLLDGDGAYWTSVFADPSGGRPLENGYVRFAFIADEQTRFNLYNVHIHPDVPGSSEAARNLIEFIEGTRLSGNAAYPPLVVGDFNGGPGARRRASRRRGPVRLRASHPCQCGEKVTAGRAPQPARYSR